MVNSVTVSEKTTLPDILSEEEKTLLLRIRLRRTGAKKQPRYRVVVAESSAPRDGAYVEVLGWYNPQADPAQVVVDAEKASQWIARGAQPSERVAYLLKQATAEPSTAEPAKAAPKRSRRAKEAAEAPAAAEIAAKAPAAAETAAEAPAAAETAAEAPAPKKRPARKPKAEAEAADAASETPADKVTADSPETADSLGSELRTPNSKLKTQEPTA
jgi:small subunit ribosomal protein S16